MDTAATISKLAVNPIADGLVDPAIKLGGAMRDTGLYGVLGVVFVLLFLQFVYFMRKLGKQDLECRKCRDNLDNLQDARSANYGKLLEQRHEQYVNILEETIAAMHTMATADERTQVVIQSLEKMINSLYNDIRRHEGQ